MNIQEIWPKAEVEVRVGKKLSVLTEDNFERIVKRKKATCHELGAFIWDQYASSDICKHDPMKMAPYFKNGSPNLLRAIEKLVGFSVLHEVSYIKAEVTDGSLPYRVASEVMVSRIWPNNLHISDIEFSNPYRPLQRGEGLPYQKCKGLGLLGLFLDRAVVYCEEREIRTLSLTAATRAHYDMFSGIGFELAGTRAGEASLQYGQGIPMVRRI